MSVLQNMPLVSSIDFSLDFRDQILAKGVMTC